MCTWSSRRTFRNWKGCWRGSTNTVARSSVGFVSPSADAFRPHHGSRESRGTVAGREHAICTSRVTTLPAPMTARDPMHTPARMIAHAAHVEDDAVEVEEDALASGNELGIERVVQRSGEHLLAFSHRDSPRRYTERQSRGSWVRQRRQTRALAAAT